MVSVIELKERGCSLAATVQPPTSRTGAAADESTPHHGTPRTTTTVSQRAGVTRPDDHPGPVPGPGWPGPGQQFAVR